MLHCISGLALLTRVYLVWGSIEKGSINILSATKFFVAFFTANIGPGCYWCEQSEGSNKTCCLVYISPSANHFFISSSYYRDQNLLLFLPLQIEDIVWAARRACYRALPMAATAWSKLASVLLGCVIVFVDNSIDMLICFIPDVVVEIR